MNAYQAGIGNTANAAVGNATNGPAFMDSACGWTEVSRLCDARFGLAVGHLRGKQRGSSVLRNGIRTGHNLAAGLDDLALAQSQGALGNPLDRVEPWACHP